MVAPGLLCFSPLLGQGAIPGEMGRRKAGGLDGSPIAWPRVQTALMWLSARKVWAIAGQWAGMSKDLWDPGPALRLLQGLQ